MTEPTAVEVLTVAVHLRDRETGERVVLAPGTPRGDVPGWATIDNPDVWATCALEAAPDPRSRFEPAPDAWRGGEPAPPPDVARESALVDAFRSGAAALPFADADWHGFEDDGRGPWPVR